MASRPAARPRSAALVAVFGVSVTALGVDARTPEGASPQRPSAVTRAQEPEPTEAQAVAAAMATLRDRRATDEAREAAMDRLLGLGVQGPTALAGELTLELTRLRRDHAKDEARLLARLAKLAPKVVQDRLDRDTLAVVAEQRRLVLAGASDPGLTKEHIHAVSDPAFARLEELLTVTVNQCFDRDEGLFEEWATLLDGVERELHLHGRFEAARAALAATPRGERSAAALRPPPKPERDVPALLAEAARLAELGTPMGARDREAFAHNVTLGAALDPEEARGVHALQRRRVLLGLGVQRIDPKLCDACRTHSKDMVEHGFFAHESPVPGRTTPWDRAAEAGTSASAENIAAGAATGPDTILQWWYSPGHHRNMLGGGARTGLGRHQNHWTQLFGD